MSCLNIILGRALSLSVGEIVEVRNGTRSDWIIGWCVLRFFRNWLKRVLKSRIRWILESGGLLSEYQSRFRKGSDVNDQLMHLSQSV